MRFKAKDSEIREQIALLRANQIARITSDFKMSVINKKSEFWTSPLLFRVCVCLCVCVCEGGGGAITTPSFEVDKRSAGRD